MNNIYIHKRYGSLSNYISNYITEENYQKLLRKSHQITKFRGRLRTIERIVQKVYPDRWDIQEKYQHINLIIWFPRFNIVNYKGKRHTIRDMYIEICFKYDLIMEDHLYGIRATRTFSEYINEYSHSHLHGLDIHITPSFNSFCLGDTVIDQTIRVLSDEFIDSSFELLLYQIREYLQWESIGGGPYRRIENFSYSKKITDGIDLKTKEEYYDVFIKNSLFNLGIQQNGFTRLEVINDDSFEGEVTKIVKKKDLVSKGENGKYYTREKYKVREESEPLLTFKGREIYQRILNDNEKVKQYAHPEITGFIANRISEKITEAQTENCRAC